MYVHDGPPVVWTIGVDDPRGLSLCMWLTLEANRELRLINLMTILDHAFIKFKWTGEYNLPMSCGGDSIK